MRPLRVLHLASPTGVFGAEKWILALSRHLDSERVYSSIVVISDGKEDSLPPVYISAQSQGMECGIIRAPGRFNFRAVTLLREYIKRENIDILHTHFYKHDFLGLLATRFLECRLISTPHGWSTKTDLKLMSYEIFDRFLFMFFDAVVPLSRDIYRGLSSLPFLSHRLNLILNGVDLEEVDAREGVCEEILSLRGEKHRIVVGYVGQLIKRKGIDTLLCALSLLEEPDVVVAIVGEGPERESLVSLVREMGLGERVFFYGYREDRLDFVRGFDVFVLPSHLEGIPRSLMEAMALGIPSIGSSIPGISDLIEDGVTGLSFTPSNAHELAEKLRIFIKAKDLRLSCARKGRDLVRNKFSALRMAREYEELYYAVYRR